MEKISQSFWFLDFLVQKGVYHLFESDQIKF